MSTTKKEKPLSRACVVGDDFVAEAIYSPHDNTTTFLCSQDGEITSEESVTHKGKEIFPPKPDGFIEKGIVLLPSESTEYGDAENLHIEISAFIHDYVDIEEDQESIAATYVMLSWRYDQFSSIPYLRVIADYGCGKSTFLTTIGSLCYRPIFAYSGASFASMFRVLDKQRGTMIIDEADFRHSDSKSELVKVLNSGYSKGGVVFRCMGEDYTPVPFDVYGPKIIAGRAALEDQAFESRCISLRLSKLKIRKGLMEVNTKEFHERATNIRNKLLAYRFDHALINTDLKDTKELVSDEWLPRIKQLSLPLFEVAPYQEAMFVVSGYFNDRHYELMAEKKYGFEADLIAIVFQSFKSQKNKYVLLQDIAELLSSSNPYLRINSQKVSNIFRKKLHLTIRRLGGDGRSILPYHENSKKLERLFVKYGLLTEKVEEGFNEKEFLKGVAETIDSLE